MLAFAEIEEFRRQLLSQREPIDVPEWGLVGEKALRVTRLRANSWIKLKSLGRKGVPTEDEDGRSLAFFVETIAGSVVDADGAYSFDTPEGRAFIQAADIASVLTLVNASIAFNSNKSGAIADGRGAEAGV